MASQNPNQAALVVAGIAIRQDSEGRYCINDLHRAAGDEKNHQPANWLRAQQTQELIAELSTPQIRGVNQNQPLITRPGAPHTGGGTFVCKELVYAYAMWISPAFHLKVIRAYDALVTQQPAFDPMQILNDPAAMRGLLLSYTEKVLALEEIVQAQKPKVAALDRIATSSGSMCITDAAKCLQIRPRRLFDYLSHNRWIYRRQGNGDWVGYQDHIQSGHLEHKVATILREDGTEKSVGSVLVTPLGLSVLATAFGQMSLPLSQTEMAHGHRLQC